MANLPIREHDLIRFVTELMVGEMRRLTQGFTVMSEGKEQEGKPIEWANIWFAMMVQGMMNHSFGMAIF